MTDSTLTAAFEARVQPALQVDGYRRLAPLHFGRIVGDVFQLLVAQVAVPSPEIYVEHTSMLLLEPHAFANFDLGGRVPEVGGHTVADEPVSHTVERLLAEYLTALRPRLQVRATLRGLMDLAMHRLGESGSPHLWFTLAVGHARLGEEGKARGFAQESLSRYRDACTPRSDALVSVNAPWANKGEQRAALLVDALYTGRIAPLLDGWRSGTVAALGIEALDE